MIILSFVLPGRVTSGEIWCEVIHVAKTDVVVTTYTQEKELYKLLLQMVDQC